MKKKPYPIMKILSQTFLKGIFIILPFVISLYILIWLARSIDQLFVKVFGFFSSQSQAPFGFGLILGILIIFFIGASSNFSFTKFFSKNIEKIVSRIPIIGTIFSSVKNLSDYLAPSQNSQKGKTVIVHFPEQKFKVIGFLTRSNLKGLPKEFQEQNLVTVFVPMSYQMGGFSIFVNRSQITETDLPFEQAMQGTLTGWVHLEENSQISMKLKKNL